MVVEAANGGKLYFLRVCLRMRSLCVAQTVCVKRTMCKFARLAHLASPILIVQ